jgi:pimeloyl-ACP methyl ester carboxylesterase
MPAVEEHQAAIDGVPANFDGESAELDGLPVFWRSAPSAGPPSLYLHGAPTNADDWTPFLALGGGIAPDLPGFGRSGKPNSFDYSIAGYARFVERFLDMLGVERLNLVVHGLGAVGLAFAARLPERIERLVVVDAVPLLPGYEWHRLARTWRRPGVGEIAMGAMTERVLRRVSREVNANPLPEEHIRSVLDHFDYGTQRAIIKLLRSASPAELARAGERLGEIAAPALVVWGERDPYFPSSFAEDYAAALGGEAEVLRLADAGHYPWLDRPELVERVVDFLETGH